MTKHSRILIYISICLFISIHTKAQQMEGGKISLQLSNVSLKTVILKIESLSDYKFIAKAEDIETVNGISVHVTNQTVDQILKHVLNGTSLEFKLVNENIIIRRIQQQPSSPAISNKGQNYSIHGTMKSLETGETIIGGTVIIENTPVAAISNEYGFYSITLPQGNYVVVASAIGMKTKRNEISLLKDMQLDMLLEGDKQMLENVVVSSSTSERNIKSPQMSMERLNVQEIKNIPVLFGERDLLKTMQLLPGVKPAGEGNSGFYVRGGAADQNLILLDEAPVYNPSHLFGFFSTFNSDAIKNVSLYKGGMPAQYGGRLSSVVDIKMNDGNNQDFGMSGGIGLIASRLNIEGPLQKNKSSFLLSGRRTYADALLKLLGDSALKKAQLYFYDLNAKMNFTLSEKDRIFISGYFGRDVLSQQDLAGINWGNATGTLRWNHVFNRKLFSNTSLIFSNYDYKINLHTESSDYIIYSRIRDFNVKEELQWYANSKNSFLFGINSIYHTIKPGEISVKLNNTTTTEGLEDRYSLDNALYASHTLRTNGKWSFTYGLRLTAFSILGKGDYYTLNDEGEVINTIHYKRGEVVKTYFNPETRAAASYQLSTGSSVKLSYTRNTQNLHLVTNSTSASPTDKWIASTNIIKPGIADQFAIGYYKNLKDNLYELTVEAYYKTMQNQVDYRDGAEVFTNDPIETQLLFGKGAAYGVEWLLKKKTGRFNGWISYTLSKTQRKINGINNNKWYNARQDRTHDIAIVGIYQLNPKWVLSANWIYYTGDAVTYPAGKYKLDNEVYFYYSERNGYRMPDYHRLDVGATKQLKSGKRFSSELNFSVFNIYGRANAYQIHFRQSKTDPDKTEAVKTSVFTFVPSISYNFKF